jgi:hypothetical protein
MPANIMLPTKAKIAALVCKRAQAAKWIIPSPRRDKQALAIRLFFMGPAVRQHYSELAPQAIGGEDQGPLIFVHVLGRFGGDNAPKTAYQFGSHALIGVAEEDVGHFMPDNDSEFVITIDMVEEPGKDGDFSSRHGKGIDRGIFKEDKFPLGVGDVVFNSPCDALANLMHPRGSGRVL